MSDFGNRADFFFFLGILFTSILTCEFKMNESGSRKLIYHFKMLPLEYRGKINRQTRAAGVHIVQMCTSSCLNCMCSSAVSYYLQAAVSEVCDARLI